MTPYRRTSDRGGARRLYDECGACRGEIAGKNPREARDELAQFLMNALGENKVSHVAVAGPGFVNINSPEAVTLAVAEADAKETSGEGYEECRVSSHGQYRPESVQGKACR